jgi:hypothetical protein
MQKFWFPIQSILNNLYRQCDDNKFSLVLEIGPGSTSFAKATHLIDFDPAVTVADPTKKMFFLNICLEKFPFADFFFDFGYSRHTFEDIWNPIVAFTEMTRTCRSGFIETPSPLVELTKGVDAGSPGAPDPSYRGYVHHRYIIWTDTDTNTLCFLPKMPIVEHLTFAPDFQKLIDFHLQNEFFWNNYYSWDTTTAPAISFLDFDKKTYDSYLTTSILKSIQHTTLLLSTQSLN